MRRKWCCSNAQKKFPKTHNRLRRTRVLGKDIVAFRGERGSYNGGFD